MKRTFASRIALAAIAVATLALTMQAQPRQPRPGFPGGPRFRGRQPVPNEAFTATTLPKDDAEKKILEVLKDISENQRRGNMIVPENDGRILRVLVESLGAKKVAEFGTSVGYSGIWMCLGLRKTGGHLYTFEIDENRAAQARKNFQRAGVSDMVTLIFGDAHETIAQLEGPIDMAFLDADKEGYIDYLQKILPKMRPGGLIVAHNINPRQADPRYLKAITSDPNLETIFLNLATSGISVTMKKR